MRLMIKPVFLVLLLAIAALLGACAGVKPAPSIDPELEKRAKAYWALRTARDFADAYPYEDPQFRKEHSLTAYISELAGGILHDASVEVISSIAGHGKARVRVTYDLSNAFVPTGASQVKTIKDTWRRIDGQWYHLFYPPRPEKANSTDTSPGYQADRPLMRLPSGAVLPVPETKSSTENTER